MPPVASAKGGNLFITELTAPDRIGPDGDLDLEFLVKNGANAVGGRDADCCGDYCNPLFGASAGNGYGYIGWIDPEFGEKKSTGKKCIATTEIGNVKNRVTANYQSPTEEGAYTINYGVTLPGSGEEISSSVQLIVEEGASRTPDPGNPDDGFGLDNVTDIVASNPLKTLGAGAGAYAAFRFLL